ncbi:MAG: hypothetical protein AAFV53_03150 [Myxococcota bacterium]
MRFLRVASRYQVQLGWLRVIADAIGDGQMSIDEVAEVLLSNRDHFNRWWEEAGHPPPARGTAQPATANRAARIGSNYGIHDADRTGALTPLGHVLRAVAPWRGRESPFAWQGPTRWMGLWMVFAKTGDVMLEVFRSLPSEGLDGEVAPDFMADVLRRLARTAQGEARKLLRDQASRAGGRRRFARNFLIYPYMEPIRDLGYLEAHGRAGGYRLTPDGARLVAALNDGRDAAAWLEEGLPRAFMIAEGGPDPLPSSGSIFPEVLTTLPSGVTTTPGRISLEMMLLLAQAKLVTRRQWIDLRQGRRLLEDAVERAQGMIRLDGGDLIWERGAERGDFWSPAPTAPETPAITRRGMPRLKPPPTRTRTRVVRATRPTTLPTPNKPLAPQSRSPGPPDAPLVQPVASTPAVAFRQTSPQISLPLAEDPVAVATAPQAVAPMSAPLPVTAAPLLLGGAPRLRCWLQHVVAQLQPPTAGRPMRGDGPGAALAALGETLKTGGPREDADAQPLRTALDAIAPIDGEALLRRAADRWGTGLEAVALQAAINRARQTCDKLTANLKARVLAGLHGEGDWDTLAAATNALMDDALTLSGRSPVALLDALHSALQSHPPMDAAQQFVRSLLAAPMAYTYVRQVSGALPCVGAPGAAVEIVEIEGPRPQRHVWVRLTAPDAETALRLGRARALRAIDALRYAARLSAPVELLRETLSPPPAPPSPARADLLLPQTPRPPMSLAHLPWGDPDAPGDGAKLAAAVVHLSRATQARDTWPALCSLASGPVDALSAAGALAFAAAWLVEGMHQAETALHICTLRDPSPERLAILTRWQGDEAAQKYAQANAFPADLRMMRYPPPPPRALSAVVDTLQGTDLDTAALVAPIQDDYPLAAVRLAAIQDAMVRSERLAAVADAQRGAIRNLLHRLATFSDGVAPRPEPPIRLMQLRAVMDPVLEDAARMVALDEPLAMHWGAVLDRFDDLRSLSGPVDPSRLLEILDG